MIAPQYLADDPLVDQEIRDVVRGLRATNPHPYDVTAGFERLNGATAARTPETPRGRTFLTLGAKLLTVFVILPGAAAYTIHAWNGAPHGNASLADPTPLPAAQTPTPTQTEDRGEAVTPAEMASVVTEPSTSTKPASVVSPASSVTRPSADLREREVKDLIELQRIATRDPTRAVKLARAGHAQFPKGALFPEREAILIDALAQTGHLKEAKAHAERFIRDYPKHPATPRMRAIAGVSPGR